VSRANAGVMRNWRWHASGRRWVGWMERSGGGLIAPVGWRQANPDRRLLEGDLDDSCRKVSGRGLKTV
jgi:hypothetical protein